jgi:hypothetical protein
LISDGIVSHLCGLDYVAYAVIAFNDVVNLEALEDLLFLSEALAVSLEVNKPQTAVFGLRDGLYRFKVDL